eukprot:sb/3466054/
MGDRLGIPGAVSFFSNFGQIVFSVSCLESGRERESHRFVFVSYCCCCSKSQAADMSPTRDSWRTGGWEGGPRLHQQFQTFQHYFKQINLRDVLGLPRWVVALSRNKTYNIMKSEPHGPNWVRKFCNGSNRHIPVSYQHIEISPQTKICVYLCSINCVRCTGCGNAPLNTTSLHHHQQFQTFQHYFKQINLSGRLCISHHLGEFPSGKSVHWPSTKRNFKKEEGIKALGIDECRIRPYSVECTRSRSISEVKQPQAGLVLGWVTAWESPVQYPFFHIFGKLISIGHPLFGDFLGDFLGHFGDSDRKIVTVRISQICEELLMLLQSCTRDSWRTGGWEGGPRLHQQFQTFQHYFKQINLR